MFREKLELIILDVLVPIDTGIFYLCLINYYCYMKESLNTQSSEQGLEFWEARSSELATVRDGLRTAYALISDLHAYSLEQVTKLTPDREEVLNG